MAVANSRPTTAETPMASAPQNRTRSAPVRIDAPPTRAATIPSTARSTSALSVTSRARSARGAMAATTTGSSGKRWLSHPLNADTRHELLLRIGQLLRDIACMSAPSRSFRVSLCAWT